MNRGVVGETREGSGAGGEGAGVRGEKEGGELGLGGGPGTGGVE